MEPLYESKVICICCETSFTTSKVRPSFKRASRMDMDFCGYYEKGVNPDYYVVRVCPHCGYASTENGFDHLNEKQKRGYYERIGANWQGLDYNGERTAEQAMETYKLALLTAQSTGAPDRIISGLLHHIAWLYRYKDNKIEEKKFLTFALESYVRVYELEDNNLSKARLMFLIGELNRRIGDLHEAVKWFSRVVSDKSIMDAAMIRASREQWQLIREEMGSGAALAGASGGNEKASTA
ncbi:DUF2225 domain-containing protein [Paenibacillus sp. strain BS8-2]